MLIRESAAAKADELLRNARRDSEIESSKSTRPMVWLFPTLAKIPPPARHGALREARNYASAHRATIIFSVATILAFAVSIFLHINRAVPDAAYIAGWCGLSAFVYGVGLTQHYMRSYLKKKAASLI
jgi:hypothetical protein